RTWNIDSAGEILCHGLPSERPHLRECEERVTWQPSFAERCDSGSHRTSLLNEAAGLFRRPFEIKHQGRCLNSLQLEIFVPCQGVSLANVLPFSVTLVTKACTDNCRGQCLLLGVKRKSRGHVPMSAFDSPFRVRTTVIELQ